VLAGSYLRTTDSQSAFSPKERVAMKKVTRITIAPVALLVLLALLTLLVVKPKHLMEKDAEAVAVETVVKLEDAVILDEDTAVAFLAVMALFGFVMWTAIRANEAEDKAMPSARESSASGTTTFR
jgi:hypothetical protein